MNDHHSNSHLTERARQAMIDNGFEPDFPREVLEQIRELENQHEPAGGVDVQDLRTLLWSSIDNDSSRDLDQVEFAERLVNGDIRLLVGIADVDSLVRQDSPVDKFAAENTVSVYTESKTFPMLPEELSTDMTSLNEGRDRLAVVVELVIKENGDVPGNSVFRAQVHNYAKLKYEEIGEWLDENGKEPADFLRIADLKDQVVLQNEAAKRLKKFRQEKGALEFESIESAPVFVDGEIRDLRSIRPNSARKIIENFMIGANVEMAEFLESHNQLSIRRVVKTPYRWDGIRDVAAKLGTDLPEQPDSHALSEFLSAQRKADPIHFPDLSLSIIKLLGSGEYVVKKPGMESDGHFGLALRDYAHSTAPNRRYPDLVVQRMVKAVLNGEPTPYNEEELNAIAEHCNEQERAARKVERKMRKIVAASVMRSRVGENFDAIVTGVTPSGTFARILRPPVDGRIVRGEENLRVGQKVDVKLLSANPQNGFIDFAHHR
jgi:VacB/RNase II family 3'-5' exoribonuclease